MKDGKISIKDTVAYITALQFKHNIQLQHTYKQSNIRTAMLELKQANHSLIFPVIQNTQPGTNTSEKKEM